MPLHPTPVTEIREHSVRQTSIVVPVEDVIATMRLRGYVVPDRRPDRVEFLPPDQATPESPDAPLGHLVVTYEDAVPETDATVQFAPLTGQFPAPAEEVPVGMARVTTGQGASATFPLQPAPVAQPVGAPTLTGIKPRTPAELSEGPGEDADPFDGAAGDGPILPLR